MKLTKVKHEDIDKTLATIGGTAIFQDKRLVDVQFGAFTLAMGDGRTYSGMDLWQPAPPERVERYRVEIKDGDDVVASKDFEHEYEAQLFARRMNAAEPVKVSVEIQA